MCKKRKTSIFQNKSKKYIHQYSEKRRSYRSANNYRAVITLITAALWSLSRLGRSDDVFAALQVREARLEQESIDGGAVASGNDAVADCKT